MTYEAVTEITMLRLTSSFYPFMFLSLSVNAGSDEMPLTDGGVNAGDLFAHIYSAQCGTTGSIAMSYSEIVLKSRSVSYVAAALTMNIRKKTHN